MLSIEITKEQFDLINEEITKLENDKLLLFDTDGLTGWEIMYITDRINMFKEIIKTEHIEL